MLKYTDKLDSLRLKKNGGIYERQETKLVKRLLEANPYGIWFVDVGAHVGYYTEIAANIIQKGMIVAFEPHEENFNLLRENINKEKTSNEFVLENYGIGNIKIDKLKLYLNKMNSGDNRFFKTENEDREFIEIETNRLDDIFIKDSKINFLKIDVQGFEYKVLDGGEELINRSNDLDILIEYSPYLLKCAGDSPGKLIAWLIDHEFFIYQKYKGKWQYADCGLLGNRAKKFHTNLFCSRNRYEEIDWGEQ